MKLLGSACWKHVAQGFQQPARIGGPCLKFSEMPESTQSRAPSINCRSLKLLPDEELPDLGSKAHLFPNLLKNGTYCKRYLLVPPIRESAVFIEFNPDLHNWRLRLHWNRCIAVGSGSSNRSSISTFVLLNVLAHQKWKYLDIRDNQGVSHALIDFHPHIWHLAAMTGMDIHDMSFFDANTIGVQNLLETTEIFQIFNVYFLLPAFLFVEMGILPQNYTEYCPPKPLW